MTPKVWHRKDSLRHVTLDNLDDWVYCGRPSKWGNNLKQLEGETRDQYIDRWEKYVLENPDFIKEIKAFLKGKQLVCWCHPKRCHCDIYLKIANEETDLTEFFT